MFWNRLPQIRSDASGETNSNFSTGELAHVLEAQKLQKLIRRKPAQPPESGVGNSGSRKLDLLGLSSSRLRNLNCNLGLIRRKQLDLLVYLAYLNSRVGDHVLLLLNLPLELEWKK
jgi:hypothetical protein